MYNVLIRPVLTYASEIWTVSKANEWRLSLFERKVLRRFFGAKQEKEIWPKLYNCEFYEIFNDSNIVNYIKVKRLTWAGHLMRQNEDRNITKITNTKLNGVRRVGRLKLRWEDGVDQDMRILRSRIGRRSPSTETNGQSFLRSPGPTKGCRTNDDDDDDDDDAHHQKN